MRLLPNAVWKPIKYRAEAGQFASAPLGWLLHSAEMYGSPFNLFQNLKSTDRGGRRFSTGWIGKDGSGEQYTELENKSWAQNYGNGTYYAFEFEGYAGEPLTMPQIITAGKWHKFLGTQNTLAEAPGQRGIGIHCMGNNKGWLATSCPGKIRAAQRNSIIKQSYGISPVVTKPVVTKPVVVNRLSWPLPVGQYFGIISSDKNCHSGTYSSSDREHIKDYQRQMLHRGWKISVDGIFGPGTASITKQFQAEKHLSTDSRVGLKTWAAAWQAKVT